MLKRCRQYDLTSHLTASPKAALVLAHGAGAGQTSPFMVRFAGGMALRGISTATFDFPYMAARRKVPDRAPVLEQSWREALEAAHGRARGPAARHRREVHGRADRVPHRGARLRRRRRPGVPRAIRCIRPASPSSAATRTCRRFVSACFSSRGAATLSGPQPRSPRCCPRFSTPTARGRRRRSLLQGLRTERRRARRDHGRRGRVDCGRA